MGTPTPKEASVEAELLRMARVSQEWPWVSWGTPWVSREWLWMTRKWPWVSRWDRASVRASSRVSWDGEACDGASLCESRGQSKGSSRMV